MVVIVQNMVLRQVEIGGITTVVVSWCHAAHLGKETMDRATLNHGGHSMAWHDPLTSMGAAGAHTTNLLIAFPLLSQARGNVTECYY